MSVAYASCFEALFLCTHPKGAKMPYSDASRYMEKSERFVRKWVKCFDETKSVDGTWQPVLNDEIERQSYYQDIWEESWMFVTACKESFIEIGYRSKPLNTICSSPNIRLAVHNGLWFSFLGETARTLLWNRLIIIYILKISISGTAKEAKAFSRG